MAQDKIASGKYYTNLYKLARHLLINEVKNINKLVIVASNCISLIAGLSFALLQEKICNYQVKQCSLDEIINIDVNDNRVLFIICDQPKDINKYQHLSWYFNYEGDESNILCFSQLNKC